MLKHLPAVCHFDQVAMSSALDQILLVNRSSSGDLLLVSQSLQMLQQHQQPLQQCAALFAQLQTFLAGALLGSERLSASLSTVRDLQPPRDALL